LVDSLFDKSVKDIVSKEALELVEDAETRVRRILKRHTFQKASDLENKLAVFQTEKDRVVAMANC
jgi:hypothetical protein